MYNKAGPQTRLSQLRKTVREGEVRCIAIAQGITNLLLRLCGWLRTCLIRLSGLLRGGIGTGGTLRLIVPGEFVIYGRHFKRHFIPGIQ
jgi:hypothetical protein